MYFFYDLSDSLFQFFQRGGDVLYLIFLLGVVITFLMFEKIWYLRFEHNSVIASIVDTWETRKEKTSFNSLAVREMMISEATLKINKKFHILFIQIKSLSNIIQNLIFILKLIINYFKQKIN